MNTHKAPSFMLLLAVSLTIAFGLRVGGLVNGRLHADEAYFAAFARDAVIHGRWLLPGDLDKPPLAIYATALSLTAFAAQSQSSGVLDIDVITGEFAARLPSLFASLITIAVLTSAAWRLYGDRVRAIGTAVLLTTSPALIAFSATAFTDGIMILMGALALRAIAGQRPTWAGMWLGAALAAKPQGMLFIPLIVSIAWALGRLDARSLLRLVLPIGVWALLLLSWDGLRTGATPFYALAAAHNSVSRLVHLDEVLPRLAQWLTYLGALVGVGGIALAPVALFRGGESRRSDRIDALLVLYTGICLAAHWLIAVNVYDRYALPLAIPLALLLTRGISVLIRRDRLVVWRRMAAATIGGLLLANAWAAHMGAIAVGGDGGDGRHGVYDGIDDAAAWIDGQPTATVIYDPWFGWHLRFYLSAWSDKRRVHYPTPLALADGAAALDERAPRYLLAPRTGVITPWIAALRARGFRVTPAARIAQFIIYRLEPPL